MLVLVVGAWLGVCVGVLVAERENVARALSDVFTRARSRTIDAAKRAGMRQGER